MLHPPLARGTAPTRYIRLKVARPLLACPLLGLTEPKLKPLYYTIRCFTLPCCTILNYNKNQNQNRNRNHKYYILCACPLMTCCQVLEEMQRAAVSTQTRLQPLIDARRLEDEARRREDEVRRQCIICFERPRAVAFLPCGHFISCESCVGLVQQNCPSCRQLITTRARIFMD